MKRTLRTRCASALLMVLITTTAVGVVVLAGVALTGTMNNNQSKRERRIKRRYLVDGVVMKARSDLFAGRLLLGQSHNYTIGSDTVSVAAADNSATTPGTATLAVSGSSNGDAIASSDTVAFAPRPVKNAWSFGLYSDDSFTWPTVGSNSVNGSVYFRNAITVLGLGGTVTQNFVTSSSFDPLSLINVGGAIKRGVSTQTFPSVASAAYAGVADVVLTGDQAINNYTFASPNALVYVDGNLDIRGDIQGSGTFYVTKNITISNDLLRHSASDHIVLITPYDINFNHGGGGSLTAEGYYFAAGMIYFNNSLDLTGALVGGNYTVNKPFRITWDPWLTQVASNGKALHAPAMWP